MYIYMYMYIYIIYTCLLYIHIFCTNVHFEFFVGVQFFTTIKRKTKIITFSY